MPSFESHSRYVATAQRRLTETQSQLDAAETEKSQIENRLSQVQARQGEITEKRIAGTSTDAETSEFGALDADIKVLETMLTSAKNKVKSIDLVSAQSRLNNAQNQLKKVQNGAEYHALLGRTKEIEKIYLAAVKKTHTAGQKVGKSQIYESVPVSREIDNLIRRGSLV